MDQLKPVTQWIPDLSPHFKDHHPRIENATGDRLSPPKSGRDSPYHWVKKIWLTTDDSDDPQSIFPSNIPKNEYIYIYDIYDICDIDM